jgi:hypothetical protein
MSALSRWPRIGDVRADLAWRRAPKTLKFRHAESDRPPQLTSKIDKRDGVDGARTGIWLNEELCQDGCR